MKSGIIYIGFLILIFLSGCATTYPQKAEDQASYHYEIAKKNIEEKHNDSAISHIELALQRPTGNEKIQKLFQESNFIKKNYYDYLIAKINNADYPAAADNAFEKILIAKKSNLFSIDEISYLEKTLKDQIIQKNKDGKISYDLDDDIKNFPYLQDHENYNIIVERTIQKLQANKPDQFGDIKRPIKGLLNYVKVNGGSETKIGLKVKSLLDSFNIRRKELSEIAIIYPDYAQDKLKNMTLNIFIETKNSDRIFYEDLKKELISNIKGLNILENKTPESLNIYVEKIRYTEIPEKDITQTISYTTDQVDTMKAVLLMPRSSTYSFDLITTRAEIEYGYVINSEKNSKIKHDKVIKGNISVESSKCQNARIQNVFGGVAPADFIANNDMESKCKNKNKVTIEDARKKLLSRINEEIKTIPEIQKINDIQ